MDKKWQKRYNLGYMQDKKELKRVKEEQKEEKKVINGVITGITEQHDKKLSAKQHKLVFETIQAIAKTATNQDAASMLGITEVSFYKRLSHYPQIKQGVQRLKEITVDRVKERIVFNTPKNAENVIKLSNEAQSENVKLQANLELLAIGGIQKAPATNIQVNVLNQLNKDSKDFDIG